ncbi:MAG: putative D-alanyl-meso-diaminopimelate endopeptidase [Gammaproteobacteria bacterium]|jgi:D-alanyl-D-alanine carboxypeptidase/D-alanyl-D-alanine-endopeptidase (penicillin-binding protein 4)|nr:putative D-alanyl-meso-diaminopimelate endopeptidase [Gammaproteobacteria bacterium]
MKISGLLKILLSVVLVLPCASFAQKPVKKPVKKHYQNRLPKNTTPFANAFSLEQVVADMNRKATAGIIVRSLQNGKALYQKDASQLFSPASNMKVITAYAALKFLGPNFVYRTRLMTDAPTIIPNANGVLQGNLYVKYDGDPTLTLDGLNQLFHQLADSGVKAIKGNLYVDTSRYDKQGVSPGTEDTDRAYCYGAPVTASILNRNCVTIKLLPGPVGAPAKIAFPYDVSVPFVNSVVTSAKGVCGISFKQPGDGRYVLDGCVSAKRQAVSVTIPIPSDCGYGEVAASKLLSRNGIKVIGSELPTYSESQLKLVQQRESMPLSDLVLQMMKKSDNLIANTLFKSVGALYNRQSATWQNSGAAVKAILKQNGVNTDGMVIIDGSGLSRDNRVTPDQLSDVLIAAQKDPNIAPVYLKALPVGGLNGTLKNRLGTKDIIGKVKAKTGSMHGVSSLSGYVETQSGEVLVFSIIVNDFVGGLYPYRALEDKLCRVLRAKY